MRRRRERRANRLRRADRRGTDVDHRAGGKSADRLGVDHHVAGDRDDLAGHGDRQVGDRVADSDAGDRVELDDRVRGGRRRRAAVKALVTLQP